MHHERSPGHTNLEKRKVFMKGSILIYKNSRKSNSTYIDALRCDLSWAEFDESDKAGLSPCKKKNNQIHALTDVGTAMGKGANTIGVRMRTTYLRHFRKHFATEVSTGSEETASAELAGFWCLFSEFSVAFSLTASDERQTTFVSPISIVFISWFALVAA